MFTLFVLTDMLTVCVNSYSSISVLIWWLFVSRSEALQQRSKHICVDFWTVLFVIAETLSQWEFWNFSPSLDYRGIMRRF
ncbi:hypothetical protein NIES3806_41830 [Microcystis aeruginosa NIES-3806]|nr:hypothetical protein NIES3806_41830 [Microcystis aeruginosa NIES-3806]